MFKKILLLQAFMLVSFLSISQTLDIAWGPERDYRKASDDLGFVGRVKDHFYTLRKEKKIMYLSKYRISDMSRAWEKQIKWNDGRKNVDDDNLRFHSFRLFKNNFIFYFEDYSRKDDLQRLYGQKIDFEGAAVDPLVEIGKRVKERKNKDGSFELAFSPDSLNFALVTNPAYEKYNNERFIFDVFSQKLEKLSGVQVVLPNKDKNFSVSSFQISRNKYIHLLAKVTLEKKEKKDDEAPYYYEILTVDPKEKNNVKEFEISLDKKFVVDVDLIIDKKDNLKCFGFYGDLSSSGKLKGGITGVFYFNVNNGKAGNVSAKAFDPKLVEDIAGRRAANRQKGITSTFKLKNFFEKQDGGVMILAEDEYVRAVTHCSQNGGCTTTYYYNYQSILGVNIDPKGNIVWYAHIPKKQEIANSSWHGSFHAIHAKGKTYIIYNDHPKNAGTKSYDYEMRNPIKSVPVVVVLNEDGKSDKKLLGEVRGKSMYLIRPGAADRISDNQSFFYAERFGAPCCLVFGRRRIKSERYGIITVK